MQQKAYVAQMTAFSVCSDVLLANTAEQDGDPERVRRMKLFDELSNRTNAKMKVVNVCDVLTCCQ